MWVTDWMLQADGCVSSSQARLHAATNQSVFISFHVIIFLITLRREPASELVEIFLHRTFIFIIVFQKNSSALIILFEMWL